MMPLIDFFSEESPTLRLFINVQSSEYVLISRECIFSAMADSAVVAF
jgi:hypothetical protein